MSSGIPLSYIVSVTSTGVRDIFSLAKLPSLFMQKFNSANPRAKFEQFSNANQVLKAYGADSEAYKFALNYFGFTSKMATKADRFTIYSWAETGINGYLQGAKLIKSASQLAELQGVLIVSIDGVSENIAVNFENATDYATIAETMQTAINAVDNPAFQGANVFFNQNTGGFIVTSGTTGENSSVDFVGGDLAYDLGLSENIGAIKEAGSEPVATLSDALSEIELENGAYFNVCFNKDLNLTDDDILAIGKWVNSTNCRFMASVIVDNPKWKNQREIIGDLKGLNGLRLIFRNANAEIDGYYAGITSSKDYSRTNGNFNTAFNPANQFDTTAIATELELDCLESNLVNSISKFGTMGQFTSWTFGDFVCGELTNSDSVYSANAFLVMSEQMALANMFNSQPMIGLRGTNNNALVISYIESVFLEAVRTAIVIKGAELTTTEKNAVLTAFGEDGETAIRQLQEQGYFYKIDSVDLVTKTINIVQAYVANTPIKKVVIANYVLGA